MIWGSGGTAKKLLDVLSMSGDRIIAIFDRDPNAKSVLAGVPIYYGERGLEAWRRSPDGEAPCNALVGAGSAPGIERMALLKLLLKYDFMLPSVFHPTAFVSPSAKVARACQIYTHAIVDAHSSLGEACLINDAARVGHDCVAGNGVHVAPGAMLLGGSQVGDHVLIGANAVVMPRVRIGDNSIVGAGAVVLSDLPPDVVAVGNPARIVKSSHD